MGLSCLLLYQAFVPLPETQLTVPRSLTPPSFRLCLLNEQELRESLATVIGAVFVVQKMMNYLSVVTEASCFFVI